VAIDERHQRVDISNKKGPLKTSGPSLGRKRQGGVGSKFILTAGEIVANACIALKMKSLL